MPTEKKNLKATALMVNMIILSIILIVALSVALVSLKERKISMDASKSGISFQNAQSGMEVVMKEINKESKRMASELGGGTLACNATTGLLEDTEGRFKIELKDGSWGKVACDDGTAKISEIARVRSVGIGIGQQRSIEATPECYGANIESGLVGNWIFDDDAGSLAAEDEIAGNDATLASDSGVFPNFSEVDGRDAITFNSGVNRNYARITHNDNYKNQSGTISFWFRFNNQTDTQFIFSKDRDGCYTEGCVIDKCGGTYPCPACNTECVSITGGNDNCDCGHLSFAWKWASLEPNDLGIRFQNDGNGYHYVLENGSEVNINNGVWHLAALSFGDSRYAFYIDGEKADNLLQSAGLDEDDILEGMKNNEWDIFLGRSYAAANYFNGALSDLRIYNRSLTACDARELYLETK